ncbi:MAG: zf-HC2 domain-containing protein [Candidatus Cloacimonadaceae bacterium]|jgi:anti-sigma factor RsiW|nr:zf-HC2 domain-containing protein [Candidatus Cloacimonadota bacterium]
MRCNEAERYISLKLDNELPVPRADKLQQHLQQCSSCRNIMEQNQKIQSLLNAPIQSEYPSWMHQRIMHNLPEVKPKSWLYKPAFSFASTGLVVALSLYMGIFAGFKGFQDSAYLSDYADEESTQLIFGENSLLEMHDE